MNIRHLIIVATVLFAGCSTVTAPTKQISQDISPEVTQPPTGYKNFVDNEYKFSFQYPEEYQVRQSSEANPDPRMAGYYSEIYSLQIDNKKPISGDHFVATIDFDKSDPSTFNDAIERKEKYMTYFKSPDFIVKKEIFSVNGFTVNKYTASDQINGYDSNYFVIGRDGIAPAYEIASLLTPPEDEEILLSIVKSFKAIK